MHCLIFAKSTHKIGTMQLEAYLRQMGLGTAAIEKVAEIAIPYALEEEERVLKPNEICTDMFYIEKGMLREYQNAPKDAVNEESTSWILAEGNVVYSVESYIHQAPSAYYLQALEPTHGYRFSRAALQDLLPANPEVAYMAYQLAENYILKMEIRNKLHRLKSLKERYNYFENTQPGLSNRIKGKVLASYLNVRPEQLSRLRKEIAKSNKN